MLTTGVDLATEPATTGLATVAWADGRATVTELRVGVDDAAILAAAGKAHKLGLDCPLGWPDDFVIFLNEHHTGHAHAPHEVLGMDWRRRLANRSTDLAVRKATGLTPLSVATDRIGLTAMRAAGLLSALADAGRPVDRAGAGVVVEVYPAATLRGWGLTHRRYKGTAGEAARAELVAAIGAAAPWLDLAGHAPLCIRSDHALDALVAALAARAAALGLIRHPDPAEAERAAREGWIALPTVPLADLGAEPDYGPGDPPA